MGTPNHGIASAHFMCPSKSRDCRHVAVAIPEVLACSGACAKRRCSFPNLSKPLRVSGRAARNL